MLDRLVRASTGPFCPSGMGTGHHPRRMKSNAASTAHMPYASDSLMSWTPKRRSTSDFGIRITPLGFDGVTTSRMTLICPAWIIRYAVEGGRFRTRQSSRTRRYSGYRPSSCRMVSPVPGGNRLTPRARLSAALSASFLGVCSCRLSNSVRPSA